jgi:amidohydrolase
VFLAEYDALNGIGHACGHNLFGATSALAAAALKQVLDETGGEIRVYGTPGEEGGENGSAKGSFVREGFFRDVDAALCVHPGSNRHELTHAEIACAPIRIEFRGRAAHASSAPSEGINALDAMILVFNAVGLLRQQLPQDVRIHGIITRGGDAPNIIPDFTEAKFFVRAATVKRMMDVYRRMEQITEGAAQQTGCKGLLEPTQRNLVDNIIPTPSFDAVYRRCLESLGEEIDENGVPLGSSDIGNVSQVIPVIQPMIRISDVPVAGHSVEKREACRSETGLRSIALGAKALALTALALIEDPALLKRIQTEHRAAVEAQQ